MKKPRQLRSQAESRLEVAQSLSDRVAARDLHLEAASYFGEALELEDRPEPARSASEGDGLPLMRFYFPADYGGVFCADEEGELFSSVREAERHAVTVANELCRNSSKRALVYVTGEDGITLACFSGDREALSVHANRHR